MLLLFAVLAPAFVVILLVLRLVHQETELAERRTAEERRQAFEQLHRELAARLQAIRLAEVNRLISGSGSDLPHDSPIVFMAPIEANHLVLPWESNRSAETNEYFAHLQS